MKKHKKKKCGFCEMRKKLKENVRESYARVGSVADYLKEMAFARTKPFKLNFNEGFAVTFNSEELNEAAKKNSKKMTPEQMRKKKKISKGAKKENGFKGYGEKSDEIRSRTAIKMAKKLKPKKK